MILGGKASVSPSFSMMNFCTLCAPMFSGNTDDRPKFWPLSIDLVHNDANSYTVMKFTHNCESYRSCSEMHCKFFLASWKIMRMS